MLTNLSVAFFSLISIFCTKNGLKKGDGHVYKKRLYLKFFDNDRPHKNVKTKNSYAKSDGFWPLCDFMLVMRRARMQQCFRSFFMTTVTQFEKSYLL